jgi:MFS family permease
MVPNLLPIKDLPNAIGLNGISWRLSDVLGPVIAGVVITWGGVGVLGGFGTCYLLNFLTFVSVVIAVVLLPPLPPQGQDMNRPQNIPEILSAIKDGLNFVHRTPVLRSSLWIDFWATFFSGADALIPAFATKILAAGAAGYGLLRGSAGVGALLAAMLMTALPTVKHQGRWVILMVGMYGLCTILFGVSTNLAMAMVFLAGTGFADMVSTVLRQTIRQLTTPDRMRGRMTATSVLFHATGPQLGDFEAGAVGDAMGERFSIVVGGVASLIISAWWGRGGALRNYQHDSEPQKDAA